MIEVLIVVVALAVGVAAWLSGRAQQRAIGALAVAAERDRANAEATAARWRSDDAVRRSSDAEQITELEAMERRP